jgi:hypothetical protein
VTKKLRKLFKSHLSLLRLFGLFIRMTKLIWSPVSQGRCLIPITNCYFEPVCYMSLYSIWKPLWKNHVVTENAATMIKLPHVQYDCATP